MFDCLNSIVGLLNYIILFRKTCLLVKNCEYEISCVVFLPIMTVIFSLMFILFGATQVSYVCRLIGQNAHNWNNCILCEVKKCKNSKVQ